MYRGKKRSLLSRAGMWRGLILKGGLYVQTHTAEQVKQVSEGNGRVQGPPKCRND